LADIIFNFFSREFRRLGTNFESPFKILEIHSKDNKTIYRIELLLENRIWEKNEIIEVENFKQFRKKLDNKLIIVLPKE